MAPIAFVVSTGLVFVHQSNDHAYDELLASVYRAAENSSHWPSCLERIRVALNGSAVTILSHESAASQRNVQAFAHFSPDAIDLYNRRYQALDPWGLALTSRHLRPGQVVDGRELVSDAAVQRSEYFADFGRHFGSGRSAFAVLEPVGSRIALLVVGRAAEQPAFESDALVLLQRLAPHLTQALRIHRRMCDLEAARLDVSDVLNRTALAVLLVDARRRPVLLNTAARAVLQRRDGLQLSHGAVAGSTSSVTQRIERAIAAASDLASGRESRAMDLAFTVLRLAGRAPYPVVVAPIGEHRREAGRAVAAIFVNDPEAEGLAAPAWLCHLYGLTATEAQIATAVANGATLQSVAENMSVSVTTVRWHMKRILAKVDVTSQAQLVSTLLRGPATLRI